MGSGFAEQLVLDGEAYLRRHSDMGARLDVEGGRVAGMYQDNAAQRTALEVRAGAPGAGVRGRRRGPPLTGTRLPPLSHPQNAMQLVPEVDHRSARFRRDYRERQRELRERHKSTYEQPRSFMDVISPRKRMARSTFKKAVQNIKAVQKFRSLKKSEDQLEAYLRSPEVKNNPPNREKVDPAELDAVRERLAAAQAVVNSLRDMVADAERALARREADIRTAEGQVAEMASLLELALDDEALAEVRADAEETLKQGRAALEGSNRSHFETVEYLVQLGEELEAAAAEEGKLRARAEEMHRLLEEDALEVWRATLRKRRTREEELAAEAEAKLKLKRASSKLSYMNRMKGKVETARLRGTDAQFDDAVKASQEKAGLSADILADFEAHWGRRREQQGAAILQATERLKEKHALQLGCFARWQAVHAVGSPQRRKRGPGSYRKQLAASYNINVYRAGGDGLKLHEALYAIDPRLKNGMPERPYELIGPVPAAAEEAYQFQFEYFFKAVPELRLSLPLPLVKLRIEQRHGKELALAEQRYFDGLRALEATRLDEYRRFRKRALQKKVQGTVGTSLLALRWKRKAQAKKGRS